MPLKIKTCEYKTINISNAINGKIIRYKIKYLPLREREDKWTGYIQIGVNHEKIK